jgi:DNA-binding transcriptional ArsR family regulator
MRFVAERIGVNASTVTWTVDDLRDAGFITVARVGRSNRYAVHLERALNDPMVPRLRVRDLVKFGTIG